MTTPLNPYTGPPDPGDDPAADIAQGEYLLEIDDRLSRPHDPSVVAQIADAKQRLE